MDEKTLRKVRKLAGVPTDEDIEDAKFTVAAHEQAEQEARQRRWAEEAVNSPEHRASTKASEHRERAMELKSVRKKLRNSVDGNIRAAAALTDGREDEHLSNEEFEQLRRRVQALSSESVLDKRLKGLQRDHEREARKLSASVTDEPAPYDPKSPHSWFLDVAAYADRDSVNQWINLGMGGDMDAAAVEEQLTHHGKNADRAVLKRDKWGKLIAATLRERCRQEDAVMHEEVYRKELRDWKSAEVRSLLNTGGGTAASAAGGFGAAFVAPYFLLTSWAPFRGVDRSFSNQCAPADLPAYGMQFYIPAFQSTDAAGQQAEAAGVVETDPATGLQGAQLQTVTGQLTLSQQLHDRGYTGGGSFDLILAKELRQRLDGVLDVYVLNQVISGGASVAGAASWAPATQGIAPLYTDLAKGREQLTDTAGVRLRPTHLFTTSDFYSYTTRQVDATTFRPWVVPTFAPGFPIATGADDGLQSDQRKPKWGRFTGTVLPGGVLWFTDDNIPASGANTQLIVSAPDEAIVLAESDQPTLTIFPETFAPNLGVVLNLRTYVAAILRHASGTATITGAAYPTTLV